MKKQTTSNIAKAKRWILGALKTGENKYFRFVGFTYKNIYGDWETPENALREIAKHNDMNTLRVEMIIF